MSLHGNNKYAWKAQPRTYSHQDPPVKDTWYTILDEDGGIRINLVKVRQKNDESAGKSIEVKFTIDGNSGTSYPTPAHNTYYYFGQGESNEAPTDDTSRVGMMGWEPGSMFECHAIKIEVRMTSVVGTNQELETYLRHYTLEAV